MSRTSRLWRAPVVLAFVWLAGAGVAGAQTLVTVTPTVTFGPVFDDNVFSLPAAETDRIWRVMSGFSATRESPRTTLNFGYNFAADRFRDHPDLTTALARQNLLFQSSTRLTPATTLLFAGDYDRSRTPGEFNLLTTGLSTARMRGSRVHGGSELQSGLTPRLSLRAVYDVTRTAIQNNSDITTHAGRLELMRRLDSRNEIRGTYLAELFLFGRARASVLSHVMMAEWAHQLTPQTRLKIEGGPRLTGASVRPEVLVTLRHKFGSTDTSDASLIYARTQTTAFGVTEPIAVESVMASATYRLPRAFEVNVQGAVYNNAIHAGVIHVYLLSTTLTKPLSRAVSLSASYNLDLQRGGFDTARSVTVGGVVVPIRPEPVSRNLLLLQVVVSPTFGRKITPPAPPQQIQPVLITRRIP